MSSTENLFTVAKALRETLASDSSIKTLSEADFFWDSFGKKDSHILRAKLFKMFNEEKMDTEARYFVFFFHSVIKNRNRILNAFENLPEQVKTMSSVNKAKEFIRDRLVQYTSAESSRKFASVHLPTTMPGLDILLTALLCEDTEADLDSKIVIKQTFAQINLSNDLQGINKRAQEIFWNNVVKKSNNQARISKEVTEDFKFHEDYYNTSASDKYNLVNIRNQEVPPKDSGMGYTRDELVSWFHSVKKQQIALINNKNLQMPTTPAGTASTSSS